MTIDTNDMLNSILDSLSRIDYIKPGDIPNIPLYMDQVTTFMDAQLSSSRRYESDKILTKTMINNYAKNDLLLQLRLIFRDHFYLGGTVLTKQRSIRNLISTLGTFHPFADPLLTVNTIMLHAADESLLHSYTSASQWSWDLHPPEPA